MLSQVGSHEESGRQREHGASEKGPTPPERHGDTGDDEARCHRDDRRCGLLQAECPTLTAPRNLPGNGEVARLAAKSQAHSGDRHGEHEGRLRADDGGEEEQDESGHGHPECTCRGPAVLVRPVPDDRCRDGIRGPVGGNRQADVDRGHDERGLELHGENTKECDGEVTHREQGERGQRGSPE